MKLKIGDYTHDLTELQFNELMDMQPELYLKQYFSRHEDNSIICCGNYLDMQEFNVRIAKQELTYEEFKQRAINTFKP